MAQLPVLTPQTRQFLALSAARAVLSAAFIAIGLTNPVPDRLGGRLELTRQLLRGSPTSDQINHLSPEFRRIGSVTLRHRWHLLLKWKGVHRTGSTPYRRSDGILSRTNGLGAGQSVKHLHVHVATAQIRRRVKAELGRKARGPRLAADILWALAPPCRASINLVGRPRLDRRQPSDALAGSQEI